MAVDSEVDGPDGIIISIWMEGWAAEPGSTQTLPQRRAVGRRRLTTRPLDGGARAWQRAAWVQPTAALTTRRVQWPGLRLG